MLWDAWLISDQAAVPPPHDDGVGSCLLPSWTVFPVAQTHHHLPPNSPPGASTHCNSLPHWNTGPSQPPSLSASQGWLVLLSAILRGFVVWCGVVLCGVRIYCGEEECGGVQSVQGCTVTVSHLPTCPCSVCISGTLTVVTLSSLLSPRLTVIISHNLPALPRALSDTLRASHLC